MGFKKRRIGDQANMHVAFFHATTSHFKPGLDLHITKSTEDSVCRRCYGKKKNKTPQYGSCGNTTNISLVKRLSLFSGWNLPSRRI